MHKNFLKTLLIPLLLFNLYACNAFKPKYVDTRERPVNARERALQNIKEGRGISIGNLGKGGSTTYQFSSSNPLWRSSLEILDFLPLTTVDYSGGVIITDWYNENNSDDSIKITVRFLSNEIKTNSLKIIVHKKTCKNLNNCSVTKIDSKIQEKLLTSIIKNAALIERDSKKKN